MKYKLIVNTRFTVEIEAASEQDAIDSAYHNTAQAVGESNIQRWWYDRILEVNDERERKTDA